MKVFSMAPPRPALAILGVFLCVFGVETHAGTVSARTENTMGCFAELSGPIAKGDAEQLRPFIERYRNSDAYQSINSSLESGQGRVCLNSPGGSLIEGVALAKLFNEQSIGTAIERGNSCLSACAVAFMGGQVSYENDVAPQPNRILHPLGKLGFHAPDLGVARGEYDENTVKKAYLIAIKSVASVLGVSLQINFPTSLSTTMLATPSDDMHLISTVGEAARWRIAVGPVVEPDRLTAVGLASTCGHVDNAADDRAWYALPSSPSTLEKDDRNHWFGEMEYGFQQEAATGCTATFQALTAGDASRTLPSGYANITGSSVHVWPYQTYGPDTRIVDLALVNDRITEVRGPQTKSWELKMSGRCIVLKGIEVADNDPCTILRTETRDAALKRGTTDVFVWPSGAKTVVETLATDGDNTETLLNGIKTKRDLAYLNAGIPQRKIIEQIAKARGNADPTIACWLNPSSGNRFCFLDDKPGSESQFFSRLGD